MWSGAFHSVDDDASLEVEFALPSVGVPALGTQTAPDVGAAESDWLCAWCLNRVAADSDRFQYEGKDHFTFSNPDGVVFRIMTFGKTLGCRQAGVPTLEHTWFPQYAWSFCQCDQCGQHLGWFYTGDHQFVGLITERLVRGQCVRN